MSEDANGEPLTAAGAVETLRRIEALDIGTRLRTEGATSMVWGLVTAGLNLSYLTAGYVFQDHWPAYADHLWLPWILAGVLATNLLWRSAHLSTRSQVPKWSRAMFLMIFCAWLLVWLLAWGLFYATGSKIHLVEPGYALLVLSLGSLGMALVPRFRYSGSARAMNATVSFLGLAAALTLATITYASRVDAYLVQTMASILVFGVGWFAGGAWLMAKG